VRLSRASFMAGVAIAAMMAGVIPTGPAAGPLGSGLGAPMAHAQNLGQRVVYGFVVDDGDGPVTGARVFLKYLKNKSIRSYTTAPDGKFRFTQVNMAEDYELWAEKDGKKSAVKTVSQWDARKEFEADLKLK
jgi:Carboxypeptidase regulatory-like domain